MFSYTADFLCFKFSEKRLRTRTCLYVDYVGVLWLKGPEPFRNIDKWRRYHNEIEPVPSKTSRMIMGGFLVWEWLTASSASSKMTSGSHATTDPTPHSYTFPVFLSVLFILLCIVTFDERAQHWHPRFWLAVSSPGKLSGRNNKINRTFYSVFHDPKYLFGNPNGTFSMEGNLSDAASPDTKLILIWSRPDWQTEGARIFAHCPENRCALTTNSKAYYNRSAAVLFFASPPDDSGRPEPKRAFPHQVFVFVLGESPQHDGIGRAVDYRGAVDFMYKDNFFNWTMTYRLDSDVRAHYTYTVPLEKKRRNFAAGKRKLAAWIVSHCNTSSERENYIRELRKYIPVDIYGKCGNLSCESDSECMRNIRNYKFYLSFENRYTQLMKKVEVWKCFSIMNLFFTRISSVGHDYSMSRWKWSTAIFK